MSHARQEIGQLTKIAPDVYNAIAALGLPARPVSTSSFWN